MEGALINCDYANESSSWSAGYIYCGRNVECRE